MRLIVQSGRRGREFRWLNPASALATGGKWSSRSSGKRWRTSGRRGHAAVALCYAAFAGAGKMKLMQAVVAKFRTYAEAERATLEHYVRLSPTERLEILFQLRAFAHEGNDAAFEGLARVHRITKQC
jgi:hypothetical protein